MWSTDKKDRYLRATLLTINCAACIAVIYIYIAYLGKEKNINGTSYEALIQPGKLIGKKCTPLCVSRACIWHANMFLKNGNSTADPCENFSHFLCDGFTQKFGPGEKGNVLSETNKPMIRMLKDILDNLEVEPESASAKMKIVYDSCVNYGSSELAGVRDFKDFLNNLGLLGWPNLAHDFSFSDISLPLIVGNFLAYSKLRYIYFSRIKGNVTEQDRLRVAFNDYVFNKTEEISPKFAVDMLKYFDLETEDVEAIIRDHGHVKNSVINLYESIEESGGNNTDVHIDCSQHENDDWHDFCESFGIYIDGINMKGKLNTNAIAIPRPEDVFFKKLFPLLHSISNRTLANFFSLSLLKGYEAELNFYFRLLKLKNKDFLRQSESTMYELGRWEYCVRWIADNMKVPLENEFFHKYLTNTVTEEISNIYSDFTSEVIDLIMLQEWIPTELKSNVTETLKNVTLNIKLVRQVLPNDTFVNKVYEKFLPTSESFFNNVLRLKRFSMNIPFPISIEGLAPYITNFEVQATAGGPSIDIHFGMLLPPFYIPGHFNLINRALLAPIIGHEFGHFIFEDLGQMLRDDKNFLEKRQCVRDQFSKFKFEHLNENLNGSQYDIENIPDNIGTALIDKLIQTYSRSEDITLPGLSYSTKQLLYMSASQMWCAKSNLEKELHYKNVDHHAPTELRLLGMMQNSRGHPEAFHCPEGSFMNPATKCSILESH